VETEDVRAVYHLYVVRLEGHDRSDFQEYLKNSGVGTGIHYPIPLPKLKAYESMGCDENDFIHSIKGCGEIVSLPMFPELTEENIDYVVGKIREFFQH